MLESKVCATSRSVGEWHFQRWWKRRATTVTNALFQLITGDAFGFH